nr:MAG TPA: protein of unknown function (DUF5067) [Caudoviricetes sp.]
MKKKLVTLLLAGVLALSATACTSTEEAKEGTKTEATEEKEETPAETETKESSEEETKEEVKEDDGIIDFTAETFNVKYVKHEFGTDYEGNKCLYYYYTFTNNGEENATAGLTAHVQCFQDGSECEMAITEDSNDSMNNYAMNEVQPGGTVEVCQTFKLKSDTEITIEASDMLSFDNKKDTQKITVE